MKLGLEDRRIDLNGLKVKNYGIGDVAIFQQVARSSMYSDPHKACIQEYLSNGIDAMRERSRVDPSFEPSTDKLVINFNGNELRISDCGIGISPERMEKGFASYYGSSKRNSDDEIGGFGLGCKTAFADPNRDSFTVDTVYDDDNGVRRRYTTYHFINSNGLTSYAELSNVEAPEDQLGTTIILPIEESDVDTYINVVKNVCKYWDKKPQIRGIPFEWGDISKLFEGDGWFITNSSEMEVVVDGIPYKIDQGQLPEKYRRVVNSGVVLLFKTGELSITSTRESLDYRGDTVAKITERISDINDYMSGRALEAVSSLSLWDAQRMVLSIKPFIDEDSDDISDAFLGKLESIPSSCSGFRVYKSYGSIHISERSYLDYSSKFSVLLSRTKKVSEGRVDSYLTENRVSEVIVIKVPTLHKGVRYDFSGPEGLVRFVNWMDKNYPNLRIREILDPKYDLQSWPISDAFKKDSSYVRKKFTKSALKVVSSKWAGVEAKELEALKPSKNVYYVFLEDLKERKGKPAGLHDRGLMGNPVFIALTKDQKDSIPKGWKPYWRTIFERASGKLESRLKELKSIPKMSLKELASNCDGDHDFDRLKKFYFMLPKNFREIVYNLADDFKAVRANSSNFAVLRVVSLNRGFLSIKVLLSYRGPGSIYDKKAFRSFVNGLRKTLMDKKKTEVSNLTDLVALAKKNLTNQ
jgi:hypothetical protein